MTTVTVEINKEQDLPALEAVLSKMGLKFHVERMKMSGVICLKKLSKV